MSKIIDFVECSAFHSVEAGGEFTFLQPCFSDKFNIIQDKRGIERSYVREETVARLIRFLVEDDVNEMEKQFEVLNMLINSRLKPILAVFSGNKSIHYIFQSDRPARSTYEYKRQFHWLVEDIQQKCNERGLKFTPDLSSTPVKKFRTPGVRRHDTGRIQKLLWQNTSDDFEIALPSFNEPPQKPIIIDTNFFGQEQEFLERAFAKYPFNWHGHRNENLCKFLGMLKHICPHISTSQIKFFVNAKASWAKEENDKTVDYLWNKTM